MGENFAKTDSGRTNLGWECFPEWDMSSRPGVAYRLLAKISLQKDMW